MDLEKLAADILQSFPEKLKLNRKEFNQLMNFLFSLIKGEAKKERQITREEKKKKIADQEDVADQKLELEEAKDRIDRLIDGTDNEQIKTRLLEIKEKWINRNSAKLVKIEENLLAKLGKIKSAKRRQNALDRMEAALLKAEIMLYAKLEKRLTRTKTCYKPPKAKKTKEERRQAKKERALRRIAAKEKRKEEAAINKEGVLKKIEERIADLIDETVDEPNRKKLSEIKEGWEVKNAAMLKSLEIKFTARLHNVKSPKAKQNVLDTMNRVLFEKKKESGENLKTKLAEEKTRLEKKSEQQQMLALPEANPEEKRTRRKRSAPGEKNVKPKTPRQRKSSESKPKKRKRSEKERENREEGKEGGSPYTTSLNLYIKEIGKIELLTREEEKKLAEEIKKRNQESIKTLVRHNLRLAFSIARKFMHTRVPLADLIEYGNLGLITAAERFNGKNRFSTYAVWWIKQSIHRNIASNEGALIRLPVHRHDQLSKLKKSYYILAKKLKRSPYEKEVAEFMGLSEMQLLALKDLEKSRFIYLEDFLNDSGSKPDKRTNHDVIADTFHATPEEAAEKLNSLEFLGKEIDAVFQSRLTEQQIIVLKERFYEGKTLEEVGKKLKVTRERVRQIQAKALKILKKHLRVTKKEGRLKKVLA